MREFQVTAKDDYGQTFLLKLTAENRAALMQRLAREYPRLTIWSIEG